MHEGGLGFGFKWNMGFMHDTLSYFQRDPIHRRHHHNDLTFGLLYAFSENFVLPISHDEVVHGKGHAADPDGRRRMAEICQSQSLFRLHVGAIPARSCCSWGRNSPSAANGARPDSWTGTISTTRATAACRIWCAISNRLYARTPALHARDCEPEGFEWLVADDSANSVYAWVRRAPDERPVVVVSNLTPVFHTGYKIPMPGNGTWIETFNSDATIYGGSGKGNLGKVTTRLEDGRAVAELTLPPLATLMFTPG